MNTPNGSRPTTDEYFLGMAMLASSRGTCARRKVGCVITNLAGHVLGTGYNGVCSGAVHCIDVPCPGAKQKSGEGLHLCEAVHAEPNAIMQCRDITQIHSVYSTASPCINCMRLIANTGAKRIVFLEEYPHAESKLIARRNDIAWIHYKSD